MVPLLLLREAHVVGRCNPLGRRVALADVNRKIIVQAAAKLQPLSASLFQVASGQRNIPPPDQTNHLETGAVAEAALAFQTVHATFPKPRA